MSAVRDRNAGTNANMAANEERMNEMFVSWQPWMLWVDWANDKLRPFAPRCVRKRYESYQELRRRYREGESLADPPAEDEMRGVLRP